MLELDVQKSENNDFSSTIDKTDQESVKATITWPIIKGGENISKIKKSSYNKQKYQLILEDTKSRINSLKTEREKLENFCKFY